MHISNFNLLNINFILEIFFKYFFVNSIYFFLFYQLILDLIQTAHLLNIHIFIIKYLDDRIIYYYINFIFQLKYQFWCINIWIIYNNFNNPFFAYLVYLLIITSFIFNLFDTRLYFLYLFMYYIIIYFY